MPRRVAVWQVTFTRDFLCDGSIEPAGKAILCALAGWADFHLQANPTKEQIYKDSGVSPRQQWEHIKKLVKGGFLSVKPVRIMGKNRAIYTLSSQCGIRMVRRGKFTMRFPHGSLQGED